MWSEKHTNGQWRVCFRQFGILSGLDQIPGDTERQEEEQATEEEKTQLRGLLGGAKWRSYQTGPQHSARLGLLHSEISHPTVKTLRSANKLCREMYQHRQTSVKVQNLEVNDSADIDFVAWTGAALGNRPNGGSTGGYTITATSGHMLEGKASRLNFVSWKSGRLHRIARSSLAAEVQAFSEAEVELMFVRLQWSEMLGHEYPTMSPQESVIKVPGTLVADSRSLYDIVINEGRNEIQWSRIEGQVLGPRSSQYSAAFEDEQYHRAVGA